MAKLYAYAVFHANLKFSSVPSDHYPVIIDRCYWPLLELIDVGGFKLGLEFSALTLDIIHRYDSSFVRTLRECWASGKCEVIGSGYVQAAFPLIPGPVNDKNLELGNRHYAALLGRTPTIAYVNEQLYSGGLPGLYKKNGYEAIVMDWDNSATYSDFPKQYIYAPQVVVGTDGTEIGLVWNSSISFQKFQHCVWGEVSVEEYVQHIRSHYSSEQDRTFPVYGSDWEIFDYKPHHGDPVHFQPAGRDMRRIGEMLRRLSSERDIELITPGEVVRRFQSDAKISLCTAEYPIPCKKQERYNATRWAVCGRDNVRINTQCYALYHQLRTVEVLAQQCPVLDDDKREGIDQAWEDLCYLWASDFRTFTTDEKYLDFRNRMGQALAAVAAVRCRLLEHHTRPNRVSFVNALERDWNGEVFEGSLDLKEGQVTGEMGLTIAGQECRIQPENTKRYRDGSVRSIRFAARPKLRAATIGEVTVTCAGKSSVNRGVQVSRDNNIISTPTVVLRLSPHKGATIDGLSFTGMSEESLICRLAHGYFGSIRLSDGSYSGDTILHDRTGQIVTDLHATEIIYPEDPSRFGVYVPVRAKIETSLGTIWKTYKVYVDEHRVDLNYHFQLRDACPLYFRLGNFTLNPRAFRRSSLYYSTVNGGYDVETFRLAGKQVIQDKPVDLSVSTHHCLGATEGWVTIGDADKALSIITKKAQTYSVPLIRYEELDDSFFLRVSHSIGETDETSHHFWRGHMDVGFSLLAHRNDWGAVRRKATCINLAPLVVSR